MNKLRQDELINLIPRWKEGKKVGLPRGLRANELERWLTFNSFTEAELDVLEREIRCMPGGSLMQKENYK